MNEIISERDKNKLIKRLFLYAVGLRDLTIAESCFNELKELPASKIADNDNVGKAFAFITCYGRIFHNNTGIGRLNDKSFLARLTDDEKREHRALMNLRNEEYAHNDPQHNNLFIHYNAEEQSVTAIAQFSYHIFSLENKSIVSSLIGKIRKELISKQKKLTDRLYLDRLEGEKESQSFNVIYHSGFVERKVTGQG